MPMMIFACRISAGRRPRSVLCGDFGLAPGEGCLDGALRGQPDIGAKGNPMSGGRVSSKGEGTLLALTMALLGAALALFGCVDRAGAQDRRASSSGVFVSEMGDVQRVSVI